MRNASAEVIDALHKTRSELAAETSESAQAIKADLVGLEETLTLVGKTADDEEVRLKELVAELHENVAEISTQVETLDNESGEKTAKLAFAMTALEQSDELGITPASDVELQHDPEGTHEIFGIRTTNSALGCLLPENATRLALQSLVSADCFQQIWQSGE